MGVVHLAPVGASPGAVTAGLSYLKHNAARFSGYKGQLVESIVLFAPPGLKCDACCLNEYGTSNAGKNWRKNEAGVADVVKQFVIKELASIMPPKGALYFCKVDPHDLDSSLETVAQVTLALGQRQSDDTGKHLWANLTGGTNVLNAALMQVATLSGLIARVYYTFLEHEDDRQFLQPMTTDDRSFRWDDVTVFKTIFDEVYYRVLQVLADLGDWCQDSDLWSILQDDKETMRLLEGDQELAPYYGKVTLPAFRAQLLNRMDGREIERESPTGTRVRLAPLGRIALDRVNRPFFKALVRRGQQTEVDVERLYKALQQQIIWEKS